MSFPTELMHVCPHCGHDTELTLTTVRGVYDGYCDHCEDWVEFNYEEALQSADDEQRIDAKRDERR